MPEYTLTLLIWIVPITGIGIFILYKKLLNPQKRKAFYITVAVLASVGILLDLLFARFFFIFPNKAMCCGVEIAHIPIEDLNRTIV